MADTFTSQLPPVGANTMLGPEVLPSFGSPAATQVAPIDVIPLKKIDSNARATIGGFGTVATEDAGGAKLIDLTAREKLSGAEFDDAPPNAEPGGEFDTVDNFDAQTVPELNKDRENFDPVSYFSANPGIANDPAKLKKLLDIRRLRDEEGLTASGVIQAAKKGGPEFAKGFVPAAKKVVENVVDVTVQPIANFVLGALTGDLQNAETRKALFAGPKKSLGELSGAAEASATGSIDLARQGSRKLESAPGIESRGGIEGLGIQRVGEKFTPPKPKSDQQLLAELSDDVEFRRNASDIIGGNGEGAKLVHLDAETLAKEGISLDPNAIQAISLVEPLSLVATGGVFKILGAAGKVIATARSVEAAEKFVDGLAKYTKTAGALKLTGKGLYKTGESLAGSTPSALAMGHTVATGNTTLLAGALGAKYVAAPLAKTAGKAILEAGQVLAGELPAEAASTGVNRLAALAKTGAQVAEAGKEVTKDVFGGAVKGTVAAAPFALASYDDEQAGRTLGAGAVLGAGAGGVEVAGNAIQGAKNTFRVVKNVAAREYFGPNRTPIPAVDSPGYGRVPELDALNLEQKKKLSTATANELDNFREGLRSQGGEIYAVDSATFRQKAAERYRAQTGKDIDPALLDRYEGHHAFFDETNPDGTKVVYLNADAGGAAALQHDAGHIFDSLLSPETVSKLNASIDTAFKPEAIADFKKTYQDRVGHEISDADAKSEFRAEQFGALFSNTPVSELSAPKGLLKTFADVAAEGASALGIDLTGGAKTPNLGAPQAVGLRNMFESAARTVLEKGKDTPAVPPVIEPSKPLTPSEGTLAPAPTPSPTPSPEPAKNIYVTPEQTAPLTEPARPVATPAVRAAAAERAKVTGITEARDLAKKAANPAISKAVESISRTMESGNPVVRIEHLGITSPGGPSAPEGAVSRKATRESGYAKLDAAQIEFRENAPADVVSLHEKTFKPIRWDKTTLIAVSTDKLAANAIRLAKAPEAAGLHPYEVKDGKFTDAGWKEVLSDAQIFSENQANGRKGDGSRLELPAEDLGLSIPAENPSYTPKFLSTERANFQNAIQGIETPKTNREKKGQVAGNLKGQFVAEANKRTPEIPARIDIKAINKQAFSIPGRVVREVNPFRNELERRGFNTRNLHSAIERLRAQDIVKSEARPEIKFSGMVTDISRAGFSPAPTEFRQKSLQGKTVSEFLETILNASPDEWKSATDAMTGGLTGGAWNLALGLTDIADLGLLKTYQEKLSAATKDAMASGDFDKAYSMVSRAQFMRESIEAATGTGSAGAAFKRGQMGFESSKIKIPFPIDKSE